MFIDLSQQARRQNQIIGLCCRRPSAGEKREERFFLKDKYYLTHDHVKSSISSLTDPYCRQDRINLIKLVSQQSAPENGLPASLGSLRMTATQMLEDMESHDVVIDRQIMLILYFAS